MTAEAFTPSDRAETKQKTPLKTGMTQAVFPLEEGEVLLQMPERFSPESFEDFEAWVKLMLKKAKRTVGATSVPVADHESKQ